MKNTTEGFILVKEGFFTVFVTAIITSLVLLLSSSFVLSFAAVLLFLGAGYLFRNHGYTRERFEEGSITSVCDAIVSSIETIECKGQIIKGECLKITLNNRLMDSGVLRTPFSSAFALNETQRGAQLSFSNPKALALNEQSKIVFQADKVDNKMVVKHYVHGANTALSFYPKIGTNVKVGSTYGFMLRGTILIFLPANTRLDIKQGDELKAGESVIGFFSH